MESRRYIRLLAKSSSLCGIEPGGGRERERINRAHRAMNMQKTNLFIGCHTANQPFHYPFIYSFFVNEPLESSSVTTTILPRALSLYNQLPGKGVFKKNLKSKAREQIKALDSRYGLKACFTEERQLPMKK